MHVSIRVHRRDDPDPAYPEIVAANKDVAECQIDKFAILQGGMQSGSASVAFLIDLPDGKVAFVETSGKMFMSLAAALRGACDSWGESLE